MMQKVGIKTIGWYIVLPPIIILLMFVVPIDVGADMKAWHELMDFSHAVIFMMLATWLLPIVRHFNTSSPLISTILICLFIMITVELLQPYVGRSASVKDILYGISGLVIWLGYTFLRSRVETKQQLVILILSVILAFVAVGSSALYNGYAVFWRWQQFPVLADFESEAEMKLWNPYGASENLKTTAERVADYSNTNQYSLLVTTVANAWSGVVYEAGDADWSSYRRVSMSIYNPDESFSLTLRIDDAGDSLEFGQRFNHKLTIEPGWNKIEIGMSDIVANVPDKYFDLTKLRKIYLFTAKDKSSHQFYLDNIYLQ